MNHNDRESRTIIKFRVASLKSSLMKTCYHTHTHTHTRFSIVTTMLIT